MEGIYDDPQQYAVMAACPLEIAKKRCRFFRDIDQQIKSAMICPQCGGKSLRLDYRSSSGEEYVVCKNCKYVSEVLDQFKPLRWYEGTIDLVLYGARCKELFEPWDDFVQRDTAILMRLQLD